MNLIKSIVSLRGIASLAVCIYHIAIGNSLLFSDDNIIKAISAYGYLGVEIFFIISGFVVPYSMYKNNYRLDKLGNFLLRRSIRVEIPYIVSIVVLLVLNYISSLNASFRGSEYIIHWKDIFANLFYLPDILQLNWLQPLYYTLKVEFQYYIIIGLIFTFLVSKTNLARVLVFLVLIGLSFISSIELFKYIVLFLLGIAAFLYKIEKIGLKYFLISTIILLGIISYQFYIDIVIVSALSLAYIFYMNRENAMLTFLGNISFSLYLIHIPSGGKVINYGLRFVRDDFQKYLLFLLALGASIFVAYVFYLLIEKPAMKLSKRIKYAVN